MDNEKITKEDAKFLSRSQTRREQADYENTPVEEDIEELIQNREKFVAKIKKIIR